MNVSTETRKTEGIIGGLKGIQEQRVRRPCWGGFQTRTSGDQSRATKGKVAKVVLASKPLKQTFIVMKLMQQA